jgi:hypothetical protein
MTYAREYAVKEKKKSQKKREELCSERESPMHFFKGSG